MNTTIQNVLKRREVVEILLRYPEREFTINELSRVSGTPYSTVWRFIKESDETGLVFLKKIGNYNVCRLNKDSPFLKDIVNAFRSNPTPQKAVLESLTSGMKKIKDIKKLVLFGSVARGEEKAGSDVDIAIIVDRKDSSVKKAVTDIVDNILEKSRIKVVPIILTQKEAEEESQFAQEVRKGVVLYERRKGSRSLA